MHKANRILNLQVLIEWPLFLCSGPTGLASRRIVAAELRRSKPDRPMAALLIPFCAGNQFFGVRFVMLMLTGRN
jgi:hypothetical protein